MKIRFARGLDLVLGLVVGVLGVQPVLALPGQTSAAPSASQLAPPAAAAPSAATASSATTKKSARKRRSAPTDGGLQRIPIEQAPPSPPGPDETTAQRAADQRLLQQQETQSAQAAKVTDQQVKTAQQRIDKVQNEQRIQDAPGPSQTGIIPAAGVPVLPAPVTGASGGAVIQDAPGAAQTLPAPTQPTTSVPVQPTVPPER